MKKIEFSTVSSDDILPFLRRISLLILVLYVLAEGDLYAQKKIDSLNKLIAQAKSDTARITLMNQKTHKLSDMNLDSAAANAMLTIKEASKIHYEHGEAVARVSLADVYSYKGNYAAAKKSLMTAQQLYTKLNDLKGQADVLLGYGISYSMASKNDSAIVFYQKSIALALRAHDESMLNKIYQNLAISYMMLSNYPAALQYFQKALKYFESKNDLVWQSTILLNMGLVYDDMDDTTRAEPTLLKAVKMAKRAQVKDVELYGYSNLANIYSNEKKYQLSYDYAMKAVVLGREMGNLGITAASLSKAIMSLADQGKLAEALTLGKQSLAVADSSHQSYNTYQLYASVGYAFRKQKLYRDAIPYYEKAFATIKGAEMMSVSSASDYFGLSECYEKTGQYRKALMAYKKSAQIDDSVRSTKNIRKATETNMNYEYEKKQQAQLAEKQKQDSANRIRQVVLISILSVFFILSIVAAIAYKNKQKANLLLGAQKQQIETTLGELRNTQNQLIHSAKMASLGELTAGIAHEIQNPLNFVNNFSEVSVELAGEMKEELENGNVGQAIAIANDIEQNAQKIHHHGKRADFIVKGMLEHSRTGTGERQPASLNVLAEEFLKLSYHGIRAKNKEFNVELVTNFDASLPRVNIVQQDIGRVLLNLFNNAFYAVNEKAKTSGPDYKPTIEVSTFAAHDGRRYLAIKVRDNGTGIPEAIKDKIMQPFFTTKPTGEGSTGLGLSLSYDIVVKGHGGSINLDTKEGEFTEFEVGLPV